MSLSKEVLHSPTLEEVLKTLQHNLETTNGLAPAQFEEEDISLLYELAYNLYQVNDFLQAGEIFQRLVIAKPFEAKYWQGFASSLHMQKRYQEALVPWSMWCLIDETNPFPHFHAAESLFSLGEINEALNALISAEERDSKKVLTDKIAAFRLAWEAYAPH